MQVEVYIKSYNRPHCLERVLRALSDQRSHSLTVLSVTVFQDGPKDQHDYPLVEECKSLVIDKFLSVNLQPSKVNLNANGNCERMWRAAANSSADAFLTFEDDILPGPYYFAAMEKLLLLSHQDPRIGMVSAHGMLGHSSSTQRKYQDAIMPMAYIWGVHRWGWGATSKVLRELAPTVFAYFDYCRTIDYPGDNEKLEEFRSIAHHWFDKQGFSQDNRMIGYDASYDLAAYASGKVHINSFASFAVSIGNTGTSFTDESFKSYRYHLTEMMTMVPDQFAGFSDTEWRYLVELIDTFHTSWRPGHEEGIPPLTRPEMIKLFYKNVLRRPMTDEDIVGHRIHSIVDQPDGIEDRDLQLMRYSDL